MLHTTKLLTAGTLATIGFLATSLFASPAQTTAHLDIATPPPNQNQYTTPATANTITYQWPAGHPVRVLQAFAPGKFNWNPGHRGVDLDMNDGDPVFPAADGVVLYAGKINDRSVISIEHDNGIRTTYEPVIPLVVTGQNVSKNEIIGTVTGKHCIDRACLHWGAKRGKKGYLDPLGLLEGPIVLLE